MSYYPGWVYNSGGGGNFSPQAQKTGAALLLVVGLCALGLGGWIYKQNLEFDKVALPVVGTLLRYRISQTYSRHGSHTYYYPIVEYTVNGQKFQEECDSTASDHYGVGQPIQIRYDPGHPEHCKLDQPGTVNGDVWLPLGGGALLVILALISLFNARAGLPPSGPGLDPAPPDEVQTWHGIGD